MFSSRLKDGFRELVLGIGDLVLDAWGKSKVTIDHSILHGLFTEDVPSQLWLKYENGIEVSAENAVSSFNGMLKVNSNGTYSRCESKRRPRYQPNRGHLYSSSILLPDFAADATRDFGLGTDQNAIFFRARQGKLYACRRWKYDGIVNIVQHEITDLPDSYNGAMGNIYDIQMQWRGVGNIKFFIGDEKTGASKLVYTMKLLNKLDKLTVTNPGMPVFFESIKGTDDVDLLCGCVDVTSEGGSREDRVLTSFTSEDEVSLENGIETPLIAIHLPTLLSSGNYNTRNSALRRLTWFANQDCICSAFYTRDATRFDGTTWTSHDGPGHLKYAIDGDIVFDDAGLNRFVFRRLSSDTTVDADNPDEAYGDFYLTHGDYLVITLKAKSAAGLGGATIWLGQEI